MSEILPKSGFAIPKDGDPKNTWGDANITGDLDQTNGVGLLPAIDEIIGEMYETPTDILTSDLKLNAKLSTGATGDGEVQILNDTQNIVKSLKLGSGIDSIDGGDYIEISTSTGNLTKESTGFKEGCIVSYNSSTRTVTLTGTVDAYWRDEKITELVTGWESAAHPENPTNSQFLYYNGTSFVWSSTPWEFSELQICAVSFDSAGSLIVALNENHGFMPHECHREDHFNIGTHREGGTSAGGVASSYVLSSTVAADRRPIISACTIKDEDLITTLPILNNSLYCQAHLTGSNGNISISVDQTDIVPLNGNRPYYNNFTGGVWTQTALSNNDYMNVWCMAIPATSDAENQKKRFMFWQGTEEYSTSTAALNENIQDYDFGEFTNAVAESTIILQFTIRYASGDWRIFNVKDIVGNRLLQLGATTSAFNYDTYPYNPLITPPAVLVEGTTYYDEIKHNLVVQSGGDTNLDVGRESLAPARVYNNTGATIANNTPISLTTFNDSTKTWNFVKADAVTNNKNIHITTQSIDNLATGEAIKRGAINDAITTGYTNGQVLYLSDTAGTYSTTPGTNKITMGKVAVVSATIGRFDAEIGYSLDEYRKLTNNTFDDFNSNFVKSWTKSEVGSTIESVWSITQLSTGRVLIGTGNNTGDGDIYYSDDYGVTWTKSEIGSGIEILYSITQLSTGRVLIGTGNNTGDGDIYYSDDYGITWTKSEVGSGIELVYSITQLSTGRVLVGVGFSTGDGDVYYSDDFGISWTKSEVGSGIEVVYSITQLATGRVLIGTGNDTDDGDVYYSDDYGISWTKSEVGSGIDRVYSIAQLSTGRVLIGTGIGADDGDIYYSDDFGLSWTKSEIGSTIETVYSIAQLSTGRVLIGTGSGTNNGDVYYSDNFGVTWTKSEVGSAIEVVFSTTQLSTGRVLIGTGSSTNDGDIYYSDDILLIDNYKDSYENLASINKRLIEQINRLEARVIALETV